MKFHQVILELSRNFEKIRDGHPDGRTDGQPDKHNASGTFGIGGIKTDTEVRNYVIDFE